MKIGKRETIVISVAGSLAVFLLFFNLKLAGALRGSRSLDEEIPKRKQTIAELRLRQSEYDSIEAEMVNIKDKFKRRSPKFTLFSFLSQTAAKLNLNENLKSLKPLRTVEHAGLVAESWEIRFEGVSLEQLTRYLHELKGSGLLAVDRVSIKALPAGHGGLDVGLEVSTMTSI